ATASLVRELHTPTVRHRTGERSGGCPRATKGVVVITGAPPDAEQNGGESNLLPRPRPASIYAFAPVSGGMTSRIGVLALDLPGFGQSEGRDGLFAPRAMGDFIAKAIETFGLSRVHAVGPDVGTPSLLFAAQAHPELFRSLVLGSGAATYPLVVEGN